MGCVMCFLPLQLLQGPGISVSCAPSCILHMTYGLGFPGVEAAQTAKDVDENPKARGV